MSSNVKPTGGPETPDIEGHGQTVSVTIVNHTARDLLRECLASLDAHPYTGGGMEIIVVDNASEDGSAEMLRTEYPSVVLLAETRRRGYGANQNLAIAASHGDLVLMLNPDAVVHAGTIDRLVASMAWAPRVAAAGGPMANDDSTIRQDRPHRFPTPWSPLARAFGLHRLRSSPPEGSAVTADGWPSGAACLVRRNVLEELGGFDESFFMYSEDTDLFARMVQRGYMVAWVDDALVSHPLPVEAAESSSRREAEKVTSELRYIRKHFGRWGAAVYRLGIAADASARVVLLSVPGLGRLVQRHGRATATIRRTHLHRLRHALSGAGDPGLAELAEDWNRRHGPISPAPGDDRRPGTLPES